MGFDPFLRARVTFMPLLAKPDKCSLDAFWGWFSCAVPPFPEFLF